jgi:hypothetical protein
MEDMMVAEIERLHAASRKRKARITPRASETFRTSRQLEF